MFNKQQIFTSKLDLWEDGTSKTGFPISFNILSVDLNWETEYWNDEYDTSLTGKKRSNIRGHNLTIQFDYETTLEPDKLETIFDELPNLINRNHRLFLYLDEDDEEAIEIIPTSGTQELLDYDQTIGVKSHTLTFESKEILNQVDSLGVPEAGVGGDADTLEGLTASQFLRSDVDDEFLAGNTLTISGSLAVGNGASNVFTVGGTRIFAAGDEQGLGVSDAPTFDGALFTDLLTVEGDQINQLRFQRTGSSFAYSFGIDASGRLDLRNANEDIQVRFKPSGSSLEVLGNVEITQDLEVTGEGTFTGTASGADPVAAQDFVTLSYLNDENYITQSEADTRYSFDVFSVGNGFSETFETYQDTLKFEGVGDISANITTDGAGNPVVQFSVSVPNDRYVTGGVYVDGEYEMSGISPHIQLNYSNTGTAFLDMEPMITHLDTLYAPVDDYVPISGGTFTGDVTITRSGTSAVVRAERSDNSHYALISANSGGGALILSTDGAANGTIIRGYGDSDFFGKISANSPTYNEHIYMVRDTFGTWSLAPSRVHTIDTGVDGLRFLHDGNVEASLGTNGKFYGEDFILT